MESVKSLADEIIAEFAFRADTAGKYTNTYRVRYGVRVDIPLVVTRAGCQP